jgi:glycerate kinase
MSTRAVVAVDKFKGSATASEVGAALGRGLRSSVPEIQVLQVPVADGGEGTLEALLRCAWEEVPTIARGPLGTERRTRFGVRGSHAFIELAEVCGMQHLPRGDLRPWSSGTYGLGQVILSALDEGARQITVGLGGSASTDGGLGMLLALGADARDSAGGTVTPDAVGMSMTSRLDLRHLDPRLADATFVLATDVENPLTGPSGAARVFAPQKGAAPKDVLALEAALENWSSRLLAAAGRSADVPGAGAAGGVGAAIVAALGGTVTSGAAMVLDAVGLDAALNGSSLVITGEGSWDSQTAQGKAPSHVLDRAAALHVPAAVVAGRIAPGLRFPEHVLASRALVDVEPDHERAMARVLDLLESVGRGIGRDLLEQLETT